MTPWKGLAAGLAAVSLASASAAAEAPLKVIAVDVEGGAATLYVTPGGRSLLIDTGWPAGMGGRRPAPGDPPAAPTASSAERIVAAARAAGVSKLDYVLITHYHVDHVGGVHDLMALMPIGTFVDHGPNRETPAPGATAAQLANATVTLYGRYESAIAGRKHIVLKAGETLNIDGLKLTAVTSDGQPVARPLPGGGRAGQDCAAATTKAQDGGEENPRSLGVLAQWGRARILALADTTWNLENRLVCPVNLIGPVDLMFSDNHGSDLSNSPTLLNTLKPRVVLVNNGPAKGADGPVLERIAATPDLQGAWQLHFATRSPDKNGPPDQIANLDGVDAAHPLSIAVEKSGRFTVTNPRNGFSQTYPPRR